MAASIAFFMTVGSASPWIVGGADHQWPAGAGDVADIGAEDVEVEREMGEDMRDAARRAASRRRNGAPPSIVPPSRPRRPAGGRHFGHAAEQALSGALAQQDRAVAAHRDEGRAARAAASRPSAPCTGKRSGSPRPSARQSSRSGQSTQARPLRRADRRAEIHHRLGEIAGRSLGTSCSTIVADRRLGRRAAASRSRTAGDITRSTLPSTTAAGRSKAIAAIAAAV